MLKQLWAIFVDKIWPLLWPIVQDLMVKVAQDLAAWIKKAVSEKVDSSAADQEQRASDRATSAEKRAQNATTNDERLKAYAEAQAWKEIAEELKKDNAALKQQLDDIIARSQVYARKRIDSEADKGMVESKIKAIKPPSDD